MTKILDVSSPPKQIPSSPIKPELLKLINTFGTICIYLEKLLVDDFTNLAKSCFIAIAMDSYLMTESVHDGQTEQTSETAHD